MASQSRFYFDSDHSLIVTQIKIRMKIPQAKKRLILKFRQPNIAQTQQCNWQAPNFINHNILTMRDFINVIAEALSSDFSYVLTLQRRNYIWALIEQRQTAPMECNSQIMEDLTRKIKAKDSSSLKISNIQEIYETNGKQ